MTYNHLTVLKTELVEALALKEGSIAIDCTLGGGGHTQLMLASVGGSGKVLGIDRDKQAIKKVQQTCSTYIESGRLETYHANFSQIGELIRELHLEEKVDGICADIGVSSPQIDDPQRGFSFQSNGPLDMRMNQSNEGMTAADFVNNASMDELVQVIGEYGEEPKARTVARAIVTSREVEPITTTSQLAEIVKGCLHYKKPSKKHPATKTFQGIRIHINNELGELRTLLRDGFEILKPGGRMGIITFHSLEDRIVKNFYQELSGKKAHENLPRGIPLTQDQIQAQTNSRAVIVRPFPIDPSEREVRENPRARSARLRVIEKK